MAFQAYYYLLHVLILSLALPLAVVAQQPVPSKDGPSREQLKTVSDKKQAIKQEQATAASKATPKLQLKIQQAELSLVDADQDRIVRTIQLEYPGKPLAEKLPLADRDKLVLSFRLQNQAASETTNTPLSVNQVFLRFSHANYPLHEVFAVAEAESSGLYKVDVSVGSMRSDFKSLNGLYIMSLDIGDAKAEKSISWTLGDVELSLNGGINTLPTSSDFSERPEIKHTFRLPEKRPPAVVTLVFLILALVPLAILLLLWARIGVNLSNFPVTLPSMVFFGSLASIFYLYFMFWTRLNMFQTLNWLALLGTVAFLSGGMLLRSVAARRTKQE